MEQVSLVDMANDWTTQMGYPFIRVNLAANGHTLIIRNQTRFLYLINERTEQRLDYQWRIPINYRTNKESGIKRVWMSGFSDANCE